MLSKDTPDLDRFIIPQRFRADVRSCTHSNHHCFKSVYMLSSDPSIPQVTPKWSLQKFQKTLLYREIFNLRFHWSMVIRLQHRGIPCLHPFTISTWHPRCQPWSLLPLRPLCPTPYVGVPIQTMGDQISTWRHRTSQNSGLHFVNA